MLSGHERGPLCDGCCVLHRRKGRDAGWHRAGCIGHAFKSQRMLTVQLTQLSSEKWQSMCFALRCPGPHKTPLGTGFSSLSAPGQGGALAGVGHRALGLAVGSLLVQGSGGRRWLLQMWELEGAPPKTQGSYRRTGASMQCIPLLQGHAHQLAALRRALGRGLATGFPMLTAPPDQGEHHGSPVP